MLSIAAFSFAEAVRVDLTVTKRFALSAAGHGSATSTRFARLVYRLRRLTLTPLAQLFPKERFAFFWTSAEAVRFELTMPFGMPPFQGGALDHYATPPYACRIPQKEKSGYAPLEWRKNVAGSGVRFTPETDHFEMALPGAADPPLGATVSLP